MPELPEVETIVKGLKALISGSKIVKVKVKEPRLIAFPGAADFIDGLTDREILTVRRRGKYILFDLVGDKTMVVHLRMTGRLLVKPRAAVYDKHTYIIFELDNSDDLRFNNSRKFGRLYLIDRCNEQPAGGLVSLGPEPLAEDFSEDIFSERLSSRKGNIKALLLNQNFIAGLGNIYTDEALFRAGISPFRDAASLSQPEISKLYQGIRLVLQEGIKAGGTSFSDYRNALGEKGLFQNQLSVYQQTGLACLNCGQEIRKVKLAGRGTHYCPSCQQ